MCGARERTGLVAAVDQAGDGTVVERDLTGQRTAQEAQAFLAAIVEGSQDAIMTTTLEGQIGTWNRGATAVFGYTAEEAIGKQVSELMAPERLSELEYFTGQLTKGLTVSQYESVCLRKDGSRIDVSVSGSPIENAAGRVVALSAVLRDISQRRRIEHAVQESEERFRAVFEHAPVGIYLAGFDTRILQVNEAFCRMLGYSKEELLAKRWPDICHPDDAAVALERKKRLRSGEVRNSGGEMRYVHRNGAAVWCQVWVSLFKASGEGPLCSVVHVQDIAARKQAEQSLVESEHRFRIMADSCPIGIWVTDAQGRNRFVNRTYLEFSGKSTEEVEQDKWKSQIDPDDAPEFFRLLDCALKEGTPFHAIRRGRRADGAWRWVESQAAPRFSPDGEFLGLVGTSQDITERKQAEQALQISEEKFRQIAENIKEVFWMMNASGTEMLYVSSAYEQIWGRTCASLYRNPMDWLEAILPEDRKRAHETFMRQLQGEVIDSEYRIQTPGGQERWISDRAFPIRDASGN